MSVTPATAFRLDNRFARELPEMAIAWTGEAAPDPRLLVLDETLATELGLDPAWLRSAEGLALLVGRDVPDGATPVAQAYSGHQFGGFSPRLGDGRALLLGELSDAGGTVRDLHLKGSGRTPFARGGDGLAVIGPMLREYIVSQAMHALGVPTTRSLAVVATGRSVQRDTLLPGAILARVASSHLRVGSFQYARVTGDTELLRRLADHAISRHHAEAAQADRPYLALFEAVLAAQADLVARWMLVGFVHGVMNTDNMTISGETIDYGPCAFMNAYDPATVYSSIDTQGRYAYANQPRIAPWNLARFGETLLPLLADDSDAALAMANESLQTFQPRFAAALLEGLRRKLGLFTNEDGDATLADDLLKAMAANQADFTLTFRRLGDAAADPTKDAGVRDHFLDPAAFDAWAVRWRERLAREPQGGAARRAAMHAANPVYIPRNHRVEAVLAAAIEHDDYTPFEEMMTVLAHPFEERPEFAAYAEPPTGDQSGYKTFCGT
jgi:uncharacterized protein YdiU (UPF0061 family)